MLYIPGVAVGMVGVLPGDREFSIKSPFTACHLCFQWRLTSVDYSFLVWILFRRPDISENEIGLYFVDFIFAFPALGILGAFNSG